MNADVNMLGGIGARWSGEGVQRARLLENQQAFTDVLAQARLAGPETREQRARAGAEQLVSTALVQPILRRMRESNRAAPPFGPNQVERTFGPVQDAAIAQRLVGSQRWALVDRLARRMLSQSQG